MSPMSPSKVEALRKEKNFKLMETGDKCVVWDEDTARNRRRRERRVCYSMLLMFFVVPSGGGSDSGMRACVRADAGPSSASCLCWWRHERVNVDRPGGRGRVGWLWMFAFFFCSVVRSRAITSYVSFFLCVWVVHSILRRCGLVEQRWDSLRQDPQQRQRKIGELVPFYLCWLVDCLSFSFRSASEKCHAS